MSPSARRKSDRWTKDKSRHRIQHAARKAQIDREETGPPDDIGLHQLKKRAQAEARAPAITSNEKDDDYRPPDHSKWKYGCR